MVKFISLMALMCLNSNISYANLNPPKEHTNKEEQKQAEKEDIVDSIQEYLDKLQSIESRFSQTNPSTGAIRFGKIYIKKGSKLRIQYDAPSNLIMVGNGQELRYYDEKMDKINSTSMASTPFGYIFTGKTNLRENLKILDTRRTSQGLQILLTKEGLGSGGYLILIFRENPMRLTQWVVADPKKNQTNFTLIGPSFNKDIDEKYFKVHTVKERL